MQGAAALSDGYDYPATDGWTAPADREPPLSARPPAPAQGLAPSLERKRLRAYIASLLADVLAMLAAFAIVSLIRLGPGGNAGGAVDGIVHAYLLLPLYLTIALYNGTYARRCLTDWHHAATRCLQALALSATLLMVLAFFAKANADFSRIVFGGGLLLSAVAMLAMRRSLARFLRARWGEQAVNRLIILAGGPDIRLDRAHRIEADAHGLQPTTSDPLMLDRLARYWRNMDQVIVSAPASHRAAWAKVLKGAGIHGEIIDNEARSIGALGVMHHDAGGFSTLMVSAGHLGIRARVAKRLFDIVTAAAAILALSPVMLAVAIAIRLEDGGPVFFRQRRVGRANRFFDIVKFRSMSAPDADGAVSASRNDARITRVGAFIRRTSLDELPQLFNVVTGDMSLVGPRPHALASRAGEKLFWQISRDYWQRHGLRPGITGLAQVRGLRGATEEEVDLSQRLDADLEYIRDWTMLGDIRILLRTVRVLTHHRAF